MRLSSMSCLDGLTDAFETFGRQTDGFRFHDGLVLRKCPAEVAKTKKNQDQAQLARFLHDIFMFSSAPLLSNFVTERTGRLRACPRVARLAPTNRARHRER